MLTYIVKRILWFIPTLLAVTIIGFFLLTASSGSPADSLLSNVNAKPLGDFEVKKKELKKQLGLDLPVFYFSLKQLAEPDTLYKITNDEVLKTYKILLNQNGNAQATTQYFNCIAKSKSHIQILKNEYKSTVAVNAILAMQSSLNALNYQTDFKSQCYYLGILKFQLLHTYKILPPSYFNLRRSIFDLQTQQTVYKNYIPKLVWFGFNNQYHRWLFGGIGSKGLFNGDFGLSYSKKTPVIDIIKDKMGYTILFSFLSIILAFAISIPLGIKMAEKPESHFTKRAQFTLFLMYSMPSFFVGVLLLMVFANPNFINIFPPSGIKPIEGYDSNDIFFEKIMYTIPYLILPLICYTYSSLAFITRLTSTAITQQLSLDYIRTAKAKGLNNHSVIWKHALKNSLLPLITVFGSLFPSIVGGSVIIESVFTIPGMGLETINAMMAHDYPFVIGVITITALITIITYLITDILYAFADPRLKFKN